jgi:hypothetical protein
MKQRGKFKHLFNQIDTFRKLLGKTALEQNQQVQELYVTENFVAKIKKDAKYELIRKHPAYEELLTVFDTEITRLKNGGDL